VDGSDSPGAGKRSVNETDKRSVNEKGQTMKKLLFVLGMGVGFILGSRAGSGPYERLKAKSRSIRQRPEVAEAVDRAKETANDQMAHVTEKISA
jgi:hypothetical protein